MKTTKLILALVAAAALSGCSKAYADFVPTLSGVTVSGQTTMPLGDSITFGVGQTNSDAYRYQLYLDLLAASQTIQYVGSLTSGTDLPAGQQHNEGHGGFLISDIAAGVDGWIAAQPGMTRVILLIGTNNAANFTTISTIGAQYASLLDQIHTDCPGCIIYDCSIPPQTNVTSNPLYTVILKMNAVNKSACLHRQSFCRYIDVYPLLTWPGDFNVDGIHPNDAGYVKIGNGIYNGISSYATAQVQGY